VLGFVTYPFILDLGCAAGHECAARCAALPAALTRHARRLDHIYSTWYFWALNVLLAASLVACSATTQAPQLKVAREWRFAASPAAIGASPAFALR
jgi:hypothetical protein